MPTKEKRPANGTGAGPPRVLVAIHTSFQQEVVRFYLKEAGYQIPRDGALGRGSHRSGGRRAARSHRAARERRGRAGSGADPGTPEGRAVHEDRRPRGGSGRSVERSRPRRRRVPRGRGRDRELERGPRRALRRNGYPAGSGVDRYRRPGRANERRRPRGDGPDPAPGGTGAGRALVRAFPRRRSSSHPPVGALQGSPVVPRGVSVVRPGRCGRFRTPRRCVLVVQPAGREPTDRCATRGVDG